MLSYQHAYHAGNLADVHKHALLAGLLASMVRKDKPLTYVETHAGRGLYDLASSEAMKTGEAAVGVQTLLARFAADHPYRRLVEVVRAEHGPSTYPGSPWIAAMLARADDRLHLAELHPQEHEALAKQMAGMPVEVYREDGYALAARLCPPSPTRGVVLIDPSYEVKDEYAAMPVFVARLHRAWNVGTVVLWYPLLDKGAHRAMLKTLLAADYPKAMRHEVWFANAEPHHRLKGSGLFIINAPFRLRTEFEAIDKVFEGLAPVPLA